MSDNIVGMSDITPPQKPVPYKGRPFATLRAIIALMLREMATSHGRSPGGYIWAILEPALGIALLSLIFSAAFRTPPMGISFPMFYATGMLPFIMFTDMQSKTALSLMYSKQLLAYPTVTYIDAILARFFLNLITQILVAYIIISGCVMLFETRVTLNFPLIILGFSMAAGLGLGIGTLNAYLFIRFPLIQRAWSILMRPMFLISCIFVLFDTIPQPYQDWLWYNPLIHVVGITRSGFYGTYDASYASVLYVVGISLICALLGLILLRHNHQNLLTR